MMKLTKFQMVDIEEKGEQIMKKMVMVMVMVMAMVVLFAGFSFAKEAGVTDKSGCFNSAGIKVASYSDCCAQDHMKGTQKNQNLPNERWADFEKEIKG